MKKLFVMVAAVAFAANVSAAVGEATGYATKSSTMYPDTASVIPPFSLSETCLYDAEGRLNTVLTSYNRTVYTYGDDNKISEAKSYSGSTLSSKTVYEYDTDGNLTKTISYNADGEATGMTQYSDYQYGYYGNRKNMNGDGSQVYDDRKWEYTFNADKTPASVVEKVLSGENYNIISKTEYTYTSGVLTSTQAYLYNSTSGEYTENGGPSKYTYENGHLVKKESSMMSRGQLYITVEEYAYTTYDAKYVVKDLQVTESAKNVITLTWKAPESTVGGYQVLVDNTWSELLSATTYTTEVLLNGAHEFAVVGIVDGMAKNISEYKSVTLNDEGVKPATDFTVVSMAGKTTVDGSEVYPVTVSWEAPVTESTIKSYYVYYSEYSYQEVAAGQTTATLNLPTYLCETEGLDGIEGVDVTLFVKVVYTTGTSEKSNEIIANPFNNEWSASIAQTSVETTTVKVYPTPAIDCLYLSAPASVKIYNAAGVLVLDAPVCSSVNVSSLASGYYFLQGVDAEGNTFSQKVVIK